MIGGECFGVLSAKANVSRHLVPAMVVVLKTLPLDSDHARARLLAYETLADMYEIIDSGGMFLDHDKADRIVLLGDKFLLLYNMLAQVSLAAGRGHYN
eukprot:1100970-Pyramimonas_sp.AAC.1